jgi:hypothetical protein
MLTKHMLHSKHFFKSNAILDKSYNFKLLKAEMQYIQVIIVILIDATATACNSTLDTLILSKQEKLRYTGKEQNYHPIQNKSHHHVGQFLPK